jgi:hypothetical protein
MSARTRVLNEAMESHGTLEALEKIVPAISERFPKIKIVVRADSGFSREPSMAWGKKQNDVFNPIGMARTRLEHIAGRALKDQSRLNFQTSRTLYQRLSAF